MANICFFYHHFGGLGHGMRIFAICKTLKMEFPENRIFVFNYGKPQPEIRLKDFATVIDLPTFEKLGLFQVIQSKGEKETLARKRSSIVHQILRRSKPDLVVFEHYPFGRESLRGEWDKLLNIFTRSRIPVYASVRDIILPAGNKPAYSRRISLFKAIFVHADHTTGFITSPRLMGQINKQMILTGRVIPFNKDFDQHRKKTIRKQFISGHKKLIVVNTGGGIDGAELLNKIIAVSRRIHRGFKAFFLISTGPSIANKSFAALEKLCKSRKYITLKKFIPDLHDIASASDIYLTMGGYNSINNILARKINAIVFPRKTDQEQKTRCNIYKNSFGIMDYKFDTSETIYKEIKKRLTKRIPFESLCDFNGAPKTARLIHAALNYNFVKIRLTTQCNCACDMCSWKNKIETLPFGLVKRTIDDLCFLNLRAINFTGGEPTLYKHFLPVAAYAKKKGFYVSLSTNGVIEKAELKRLSIYIDCMDVSLDSENRCIHDKIRNKKGAFIRTLKTIRWMAKQNKIIQINSVLRPDNFETIPQIIPMLSRYVSKFNFALADTTQNGLAHLKFKARQLEKLYLDTAYKIFKNAVASGTQVRIKPFFPDLEDKPPQEVLWHLTKYRQRYRKRLKDIFGVLQGPCSLAKSMIRINTNGDISPCCSLDDYPSPIGNILKNNLADIMASDRCADFLKKAAPGKGPCSRCREGYRIYRHDFD